MSLSTKAQSWRTMFATACAVAITLASIAPAAAVSKSNSSKDKPTGRYYLKDGPCDLDEMPNGAIHQWTAAGESIIHKVAYGQGLQQIAASYGFDGDTAYRILWDANPQLTQLRLERSGITLRIPACYSRMVRRAVPKPPPPPKPSEDTDEDSSSASSDDGGSDDTSDAPDDAPSVPSGGVWDALAECESGGNWSINTGNGYYGGLQFSAATWKAVGGSGLPHEHSREEQIKRGQMLQERSGWGQWPHCSAKLGLT